MKGWFLERAVRMQEARLGVRLDYLRALSRAAPGAFWRMALMLPLAGYRRRVSSEELHLVRLGASLALDCGACVEIALRMARAEGVPPDVLAAAAAGRAEALTDLQVDALEFGAMVARGAADADLEPVRARIVRRLGESGVVEYSLAAATAAFYPTLKRAMGFASACDLGTVERALSVPDQGDS